MISGKDRGLAAAAKRCMEAGATRVIRIKVPVAAHCPLMQPARETFEEALVRGHHGAARLPGVLRRRRPGPHRAGRDQGLLVEAITAPVRFTEAVRRMRDDGFTTFIETGPGKVLRSLVRQIDADAELDRRVQR